MGYGWSGVARAAILLAWAGQAVAQDVRVTFSLPQGADETPVSWSALPLDLQDAGPVVEPGDLRGPWTVDLPAGSWLVSGVSGAGNSYETIVQIRADGPGAFDVPASTMAGSAAYSCNVPAGCAYADAASGLKFALPDGWGAETPVVVETPDGRLPKGPTGGFFQLSAEGAAYWALNPLDWVDGETGPCREIAIGRLCTYEDSEAARAGYAVIAPSLSWTSP